MPYIVVYYGTTENGSTWEKTRIYQELPWYILGSHACPPPQPRKEDYNLDSAAGKAEYRAMLLKHSAAVPMHIPSREEGPCYPSIIRYKEISDEVAAPIIALLEGGGYRSKLAPGALRAIKELQKKEEPEVFVPSPLC